MKAVALKKLKEELSHKSANELMELCLHLSKFKKENKEFLTYLMFESHDEEAYIESVKSTNGFAFCRHQHQKFFLHQKKCEKNFNLDQKVHPVF